MKQQFETKSKRILDLMIHSIYTNKEIFLRELISNASDALDKRYLSILQGEGEDEGVSRSDLKIQLKLDEEKRIIEIIDNGIGMSKEDMEDNLGVIAESGSLNFKNLNESDEISIIGQFGVGFYSAFMVAKKVEVISKKQGHDAYRWVSEGSDGYELFEDDKEDIGSIIRLYLKDDEEDGDSFGLYADQYYVQELVEKYSNYIKYPIVLDMRKTRAASDDPEDTEVETYYEHTTLNSMIPIWEKDRADLKDEDYINFYKDQHYGFDEPLSWVHLNAEGLINYRAILYIPSKTPFDFYTKDYKAGLELYSNGVMIMEKNEDLIPDYLAFVKGVVDSEDISLNISREMLQNDRRMQTIAKNIERRVLGELRRLLKEDREKYIEFYENFGTSLKAAIYTSYGQKRDLADLLVFKTSKSEDYKSLDEYVENLDEGQDSILYAAGKSYESIDKNPALAKLKESGKEIIYLLEDIDEFMIKMLNIYKDLPIKSAFDEEIEEDSRELDETEKENRKSLFEKMKSYLGEEVVEVKETSRLDKDAAILVSRGDFSIEMEKTFSNQPDAPAIKADKVLEINPNHKIFDMLMTALSENDQEKLEKLSKILYDQARLIVGLAIEDVVAYTNAVMDLIK